MVNRPSVPEIITVNSETLQTQIRDLLPSQNGFGSELQATNVITPIIDLTAAAEGSGLPTNLQTALAFGSQTAFDVTTGTTTLANSPGFYRCTGIANLGAGSTSQQCKFELTDGATIKVILQYSGTDSVTSFDFIVWLASGESLTASATNNNFSLNGSIRQIADSEGNLVQPSGYPL